MKIHLKESKFVIYNEKWEVVDDKQYLIDVYWWVVAYSVDVFGNHYIKVCRWFTFKYIW